MKKYFKRLNVFKMLFKILDTILRILYNIFNILIIEHYLIQKQSKTII